MPNNLQLLRSTTPGNRPPNTRLDGEPYVNFSDKQFGVMQGGSSIDLIGVRFFSTLASYAANQVVNFGGQLYSAKGAVAPGAWNATQWTPLISGGTFSTTVTASPTAQATPQFVGATFGYFGGTAAGQSYVGANTYFDALSSPTPVWRIGNTATSGYGALLVQAGGVYWAGAGGSVTGGATVTPTFYKLWSQADFSYTPFPASGGTITGNLIVNGTTTTNNTTTHAGFLQANGGAQFYSTGGNNTAAGMVQLYNMLFRNDYYVGYLGSTTNSFGATPSAIWGVGSWAGVPGGGGAIFARSDRVDCYMMGFLWGTGSLVGTISTNGASVSYNTTSDGRFKENIRELTDDVDVGELIDAMRPVAFEWTDREGIVGEPGAIMATARALDDGVKAKGEKFKRGTPTGHGFIAQELINVAPYAVNAPDDGRRQMKEFGKFGHTPWGVDFGKLMPYVIAELQALRKRVAELEAQLK